MACRKCSNILRNLWSLEKTTNTLQKQARDELIQMMTASEMFETLESEIEYLKSIITTEKH